MKVTTILPDELISQIKDLSNGKNITESLKIALNEWIQIQNLKRLNKEVKKKSLNFLKTAGKIRSENRKS